MIKEKGTMNEVRVNLVNCNGNVVTNDKQGVCWIQGLGIKLFIVDCRL